MASSRIYFRAARAADRDIVLGFSQRSFYWGDYLANVWDRWLRDSKGKLLVATHKRRPVAVSHYTMVAAGEAWCEGLRVDPTFRMQGIATMMAGRCLKEVRKLGATVARFATHSTNEPVHRMAAGLGFEKVVALRAHGAKAVRSGPPLLRPTVDECQRLLSFLEVSAVFKAMGGLCNTGWRFQQMNAEVLKKRLEKELVRVVERQGRPAAVAMVGPGYGNIRGLAVSYADGEPDALTALLYGLRAEADGYEPAKVMVWLPELSACEIIFDRAGFTRPAEGIWVYQMELKDGKLG